MKVSEWNDAKIGGALSKIDRLPSNYRGMA